MTAEVTDASDWSMVEAAEFISVIIFLLVSMETNGPTQSEKSLDLYTQAAPRSVR